MSWPMVKLGDIFDISSSKRVHQKDWRGQGVPFYRAREIVCLSKDGFVDNDLFIDELLYEEFERKSGVPQAGDILISAVGTLGRAYIVKASDKFYFKDASVIWLKKKVDVDSSYIWHVLNSDEVQRFIQNSSGATVGTYTISRANETQIPLPPLAEQKRIAAILDKADSIRRKRQQAIKLADDFLRVVFLEMFGDPLTNPKGWEFNPIKLGLKAIASGWSANGDNRSCEENELGVLKISAVTTGKFIASENKAVVITDVPAGKKLVFPKKGDMLFSRANTRELVAASCIVQQDSPNTFLPDKLWLIKTDECLLLSEFLNYLLKNCIFRRIVNSHSG